MQRYGQRLGLVPADMLVRLDSQVQFQFLVDAVYALVVPAKASFISKVVVAQAEAPALVTLMDMPLFSTASWAASRLEDGLTIFLRVPPERFQP